MATSGRTGPLKGTVDLLILRTLELAPLHGVGVSDRIRQTTRGTFALGPGSLFPALHRLEQRGFITGQWQETDEGRRAKFYTLTSAGQRRLKSEQAHWRSVVEAMELVLADTRTGRK